MASMRYSLSSIAVPATVPLNSGLGSRVMIWTTPPEAFLPYKVPCGPRSTSTRSISARSRKAMPDRPSTTPSTMVETLGSTPGLNVCVPMPRILNDAVEGPELACKLRVGSSVASSAAFFSCASASVLPERRDTLTATSCRFCSRFRAVTTNSSSMARSPVWGFCCAQTGDVAADRPLARSTGTSKVFSMC